MSEIARIRQFGFELDEEPKSIYPFSPVYRINQYIVKRTQAPLSRATRLMNFTTFLHKHGIDIVIPVSLPTANPQQVDEKEVYVVYPFISGETYRGTIHQIRDAGSLLGKIHALSPKENTYLLDTYDVFDFTLEEVEESIQKISQHVEKKGLPFDLAFLHKVLLEAVTQQEQLKTCTLLSVASPYDYKANNLIYTPKPYVIDPDNATWIPRIFDLALSLLLFHNELSTAPDRVFTPNEWNVFLNGYQQSVQLTEREVEQWSIALKHIFLDEVMWLMAAYEEDWENHAQQKLFQSLLHLLQNMEAYSLKKA
ncbi:MULTISPECIES: phosphotransferase [unclassified Virgibacillus]|uniref:phosphotransferase n=1 Tax=unclassified Virgibacillus TaxID=2620237 RepID=UPI0024DE46BD|nr:phosphotransferase [Virgibacillus sp. LDC-1]